MRTLAFITLLFALSTPLTACNTVEGFGQDVEHAGETIQDAF